MSVSEDEEEGDKEENIYMLTIQALIQQRCTWIDIRNIFELNRGAWSLRVNTM
jgi:hypothetical protein